jgi:hypothetical protein
MSQVRIKLLHNSSHPDAIGKAGEEINCCEHIAQRFIDGKGAELVDSIPEPAPVKRPVGRKKAKKIDGD